MIATSVLLVKLLVAHKIQYCLRNLLLALRMQNVLPRMSPLFVNVQRDTMEKARLLVPMIVFSMMLVLRLPFP